ncbi:MAG TPA: pirin family protein [Steroidobacteraceae bacterium]
MVASPCKIERIVRGTPTSDGAGVRLTRLIGGADLPDLDPFLLLDQFGTEHAADYIGGFPSHPHRGFETVTYMLDGRMRHRDNHGHEGLLGPGSVQWMTAGRGIVHSEMPEQEEGLMRGFQLWVNLAAKDKMTEPRYQEFQAAAIPIAEVAAGTRVKVIAGRVAGIVGPVVDVGTDPVYLDVMLQPGASFEQPITVEQQALLVAYEGHVVVGVEADAQPLRKLELAVLARGELVRLRALAESARVLLIAGTPLREPIVRYGPFVMNTRAQLQQAFEDFNAGRL